jgi:hypothetical protein
LYYENILGTNELPQRLPLSSKLLLKEHKVYSTVTHIECIDYKNAFDRVNRTTNENITKYEVPSQMINTRIIITL